GWAASSTERLAVRLPVYWKGNKCDTHADGRGDKIYKGMEEGERIEADDRPMMSRQLKRRETPSALRRLNMSRNWGRKPRAMLRLGKTVPRPAGRKSACRQMMSEREQ